MITVSTNINQVVRLTNARLDRVGKTDQLLRVCAISVLALMKKRIHQDGIASDGTQIGTYSKGYMKIRTGNFRNSARVTRGANVGKLKDAGVFTKKAAEAKRGTARPKYNRGTDTKVIASLTREMENDMKVISLPGGSYGIGFSNKHNFDKSQWVTATYKKPIFNLAQTEISAINDIVTDALSR